MQRRTSFECTSPWVATSSTTQVAAELPQQTSSQWNSSSTASYLHPTQNLWHLTSRISIICHPWNATIISEWSWNCFLKTSLTSMAYESKQITMEIHTVKSAVECTVFPRQASFPRNSSSNIYSKQDSSKAKSRQDIGNTSGGPSASHW